MAQSASQRDIHQKLADLQEYLRSLGTVAVAFSGGVDSSLLLKVAHDTLGDGAFAITAETHTMPSQDKAATEEFCRREGIRQYVLAYDELQIPGFAQNPPNRCYLCKTALFQHMAAIASEHGAAALAEGSNLDDEGDYRPGLRAVAEQGAKSPLRHAGLYKQDIRDLSRELGLPTWDKPAAACLSSRFPYWHQITEQKLAMVDAAENYLRSLGVGQVRVRIHDDLARIEVSQGDIDLLARADVRAQVDQRLRELGFAYVTLDLAGFRSGSMNETLSEQDKAQ